MFVCLTYFGFVFLLLLDFVAGWVVVDVVLASFICSYFNALSSFL